MDFTRRAWGAVAVAAALAALAVVFARPLLLAGAAAVGGWVLARQWRFVADARSVQSALAVTQSPATPRVTAGNDVDVALLASLDEPASAVLRVQAMPPVGTRAPEAPERTATVAPGETSGERTFPLDCPVAGRHRFDPAVVTVSDASGLFETRFEVDADAELTAAPRAPRRVHVGEGGDPIAAFGQHSTDARGRGIEPAQVREYVPGDPIGDVDWKATARLTDLHVREHVVETDRRALLVVDHRASMGAGPPGERPLDYLRQVALAYLDAARRNGEPVGLLAVGDDGVTERVVPDATAGHYERVARLLQDLEPTPADDGPRTPSVTSPTLAGVPATPRSPASARRAAAALDGDDSVFARRLGPFFDDSKTYVRRVTDDPLYAAVTTDPRGEASGAVTTLLFTDDRRRVELRETVEAAGGGDDSVVAFVAPSGLFESEVGNLEAAYDEYVDFERFRRDLAARPRAAAFEVAPGDRVEAVLAAGRADR